MKHARVEKASLLVFKMVFYTLSSVWGYLLYRDSEMMPSWLGGDGDVLNLFKSYPYATQHPGLLIYSLVQMGYVIEDIFEHLFVQHRTNDFWEMNFHDFLSVSLFGSMIVTNTIMFGAMISLLHNLSDIPTTITRVLSQTKFKNGTIITFLINIVVWIATRLVMLPILLIAGWKNLVFPIELSQF